MPFDWDKLRLFQAVADAGSFTEAARRLKLSQPALSRQIIALEDVLGAKLFHRHARGLALTHEGEQLNRTARAVLEEIERARMAIEATRNRPTGEIRLTTTVSFGATWLAGRLAEFLGAYPDLRVSLILSDEEVDLARREADCAIRFHPPHQAELIQRPLGTIRHRLVASPAYLARHGEPKTLEELNGHRMIAYGREAPAHLRSINWALEAGGQPREPVLAVNNSFGVLQAVMAGAGIAALPSYLVAVAGDRVRTILPDAQATSFQLFFVYPSELRGSVRIAALRDFLVKAMTPAAMGDG